MKIHKTYKVEREREREKFCDLINIELNEREREREREREKFFDLINIELNVYVIN